jgi:hypothetical protein
MHAKSLDDLAIGLNATYDLTPTERKRHHPLDSHPMSAHRGVTRVLCLCCTGAWDGQGPGVVSV